MACTRIDIIDTAKKYLGCNEANGTFRVIIDGYNKIKPLPNNYKLSYKDSWCAAFVSFVAYKTHATDIIPIECSCQRMITKAKAWHIWEESDKYHPSVGDIVMYDWNDDGKGDNTGWADHVGIVYSVDRSGFSVIEGNKSNKVGTRRMGHNARYIRGFITPSYLVGGTFPSDTSGIERVARLVIRGDYGNGEERKQRLRAAGFDPELVQKYVNKILEG